MEKVIFLYLFTSMMKKTLIFLMLFLASCAHNSNNNLPCGTRNTFVKIEKTINVLICDGKECKQDTAEIMGSGVVIASRQDGSYVLTAAHVCESESMVNFPFILEYAIDIQTVNLYHNRYRSEIINMDPILDTCILFAHNLKGPVAKISRKPPKVGERVYNVAAPANIFYNNVVPIIDGFFSGNARERGVAIYSIPATGGSSGSPIFNSKGYLIGMIHSVNIHFPVISISPTHRDLVNFISYTVTNDMNKLLIGLPDQEPKLGIYPL